MAMSENPRQPRPDDAVLGGQSQAPKYGAVLGGIEGVKLRLGTDNLEIKKAALQDALKYGDKGIEVLFGILEQKESWELEWLAYSLLEKQPSAIIKARLEKHFPWYGFESVTVNRHGEIIKQTPGRAKYYREDLGNGIYVDMVYIPGGKFIMGSLWSEKDSSEDERPQHEVTVPSYWMGKYPVTQEQYRAVMGNNPSEFRGAKRPVESVN
jgi:formylglycine-generating enzyme required for sulfatase activity